MVTIMFPMYFMIYPANLDFETLLSEVLGGPYFMYRGVTM